MRRTDSRSSSCASATRGDDQGFLPQLSLEPSPSDVTLTLGNEKKLKFHNHHTEEEWTITFVETGEEAMTACALAHLPYIGKSGNFR